MGLPVRRQLRRGILLAAIVAATAGAASAICVPFLPFGQAYPSCGGSYCYVVSPGYGTDASLRGAFWSFGTGNPAVGSGDDNGSHPLALWLPPWESKRFIQGSWSDSGAIDGCIAGKVAPGKTAEIMAALFADENGAIGYFAVASARWVEGDPAFDFTLAAGGGEPRDIDLVELPRVSAYAVNPDTYTFHSPSLATIVPGIYGDGSLTATEIAKGYRVYGSPQERTSRSAASGWVALTGVVPIGQDVTVGSPCPTDDGDQYFAYSLVFDGGFETAYVGRSTRAICNRCPPDRIDADHDGWPGPQADPECVPGWERYDCDDGNPNVHPDALETCNGIDDDCDQAVDDVAVPGSPDSLRVDREAAAARVGWTALPVATSYDAVRGDLATLRGSGGDFSDAIESCLANDLAATSLDDAGEPAEGGGRFYLVRASNCAGAGSYDGPGARQAAPRDASISGSSASCP